MVLTLYIVTDNVIDSRHQYIHIDGDFLRSLHNEVNTHVSLFTAVLVAVHYCNHEGSIHQIYIWILMNVVSRQSVERDMSLDMSSVNV